MSFIKQEIAKRRALRKSHKIDPDSIFDTNFKEQMNFIKDPAKLKALFCTRRAAKSYTAGLYLVYEALTNPGVNCLFLGLTRASAKGIIWKDILKEINRKFNLGAKFNSTELSMTLDNGSVITATGADADQDEMNKLLGRKYRLVCIDEASMYTVDMHKLVYGILKPAMADVAGTICMMGTSSNFTRGLFYDITTKKEAGWKLFEWSAHDNPHIKRQWQEELDEIDRLRPLFKETPLYKQWYLNQWVIDNEKLVYKFDAQKNVYQTISNKDLHSNWTYILGVDTGWEDDNAFVLTGYHDQDKTLYIIDTYNKSHMTFDQVIVKINEFINNKSYPISKVIIDGANKQGVESMRQRSLIPFEYADKQGKVDFIEMLNADLVQGRIKVSNTCRTLINELMGLVWMTDGDKIKLPKKEHPALPNHLCFVAGTMVETIEGPKPIELLTLEDRVLTRKGYKNITRCGVSGTKNVVKLIFSNDTSIITTYDHPFFTKNRGFVCAQDLTQTDKLLHITELNSIDTQNQKEEQIESIMPRQLTAIERAFMYTFMSSTTGRLLKDGTFITKTITPKTTLLKTWSVFPKNCITMSIKKLFPYALNLKRISSIWRLLGILQKFGIPLQKDENGVNSMLLIKNTQKEPQKQMQTMLEKDELQKSIMKIETANGVIKDTARTNIVSNSSAVALVTREILTQKEEVYALEINEQHEYFANNLLVSNCDAFLYAWRMGFHYSYQTPEPLPQIGTPEWEKHEVERMREIAYNEVKEEQNRLADNSWDIFNTGEPYTNLNKWKKT